MAGCVCAIGCFYISVITCEGFFGRLKNEFFYYRDWGGVTVDSFMEMLNEYIVFYNERRKKQSLGWMSPRQYRSSKGLAA